MKKFLVILLLCAVTSTIFAGKPLRGTAIWIVDGDTVLLRRGNKLTTIRLWGIDAPEKKASRRQSRYIFSSKANRTKAHQGH